MSPRPPAFGHAAPSGRFDRRRAEPRAAARAVPDADTRLEYDDEVVHRRAGDVQERFDARAAAGWRVASLAPDGPDTVLVVFERPVDAGEPAVKPPARPAPSAVAPWPPPELLAVSATPTVRGSPAPPPASPVRVVRVRRRSGWTVAGTALLALAAAALVAVLLLADLGSGVSEAPTPQRAVDPSPASPPERVAAPVVPSCASVPPDAGTAANVICRAPTKTITIAAGTRALILDGLELRVFRATRAAGAATVVARVRNTTPVEQAIGVVPSQFYLSAGGRRTPATIAEGVMPVPPGEARTVTLQLALTPGQQRAMDASGNRADLGVLPFGAPPDGDRLGVVRLMMAA